MSDKQRYPTAQAQRVADEMMEALCTDCELMTIAGSLRRGKPTVGDVEILYVPKLRAMDRDMFGIEGKLANLADYRLEKLLRGGQITKRLNAQGYAMWGPRNKFAVHAATGIPLDFFEANERNWFNYLVCRTGGAENNMAIASAARAKGWMWHPYREGFTDNEGNMRRVNSEREVYELAGLPYAEPKDRK